VASNAPVESEIAAIDCFGCRALIDCSPQVTTDWCKTLITIAHVRAARGLIGWSKARLAREADLPLRDVKDYEAGEHVPDDALEAMRQALEAAGVEFLNGGQPGVRMKAPPAVLPVEELNASNDE